MSVRTLFFAVALTASLVAPRATLAQDDLRCGELLPTIACAADPSQSYALYLPERYDPVHAWPIIYGFDPSARGAFVAERFVEAAERRGYIVAVSNNSRNGPREPNIDAANAMFRDTQTRLNIDRRRIVLTGCSGGGSLILALAEQLKVFGLIVCGAPWPSEQPPRVRDAVVYATAGIYDFNYPSMRRMARGFAQSGQPHRLSIVDTDHTWLPAEEAVEALIWMDLQGMRQGLLPSDESLLTTTYERRRETALRLPIPERAIELRSLAADFDGSARGTRAAEELAALGGAREIKAWEKRERADEARQEAEMATLLDNAIGGDIDEVQAHIASLRKSASRAKSDRDRIVARRILGSVSVGAMQAARAAQAEGKTQLALRLFEMRTWVAEDDGRVHFDLARAQAKAGSRGPTLDALARAAALGFDVATRTANDRSFDFVRDDPAFQRLTAPPGASVGP